MERIDDDVQDACQEEEEEEEEEEELPKVQMGELVKRTQLGRGEFGTVWSGLYQGSPVAIKILRHPGVSTRDFRRECRALRCGREEAIVIG